MSRSSPCESRDIEPGSNVLVEVEPGQSMFDACPGAGPDENVLAIIYERTPGEWYTEYRAKTNVRPGRLSVVAVGETARSGPETIAGETGLDGVALTETGSSPADTGWLCERIGHALDEFGGEPTVVYFDSLTALLRYVDPRDATRFLHPTSWKVRQSGATAYYRFDNGTHDERIATRLEPLFDETRSTASDEG